MSNRKCAQKLSLNNYMRINMRKLSYLIDCSLLYGLTIHDTLEEVVIYLSIFLLLILLFFFHLVKNRKFLHENFNFPRGGRLIYEKRRTHDRTARSIGAPANQVPWNSKHTRAPISKFERRKSSRFQFK